MIVQDLKQLPITFGSLDRVTSQESEFPFRTPDLRSQ